MRVCSSRSCTRAAAPGYLTSNSSASASRSCFARTATAGGHGTGTPGWGPCACRFRSCARAPTSPVSSSRAGAANSPWPQAGRPTPAGAGGGIPPAPLPQGGRDAADLFRGRPRLHELPAQALSPDPLHQPARTPQPRDRPPCGRRRHLPQPPGGLTPNRRRPHRAERRMGCRHSPLLLPAIDGQALRQSSERSRDGPVSQRRKLSPTAGARNYTTPRDLIGLDPDSCWKSAS